MFFLISQDFLFTLKFKLLFNRQLNIKYLGDIIQQWLVAVKIALQLTRPRNAMPGLRFSGILSRLPEPW